MVGYSGPVVGFIETMSNADASAPLVLVGVELGCRSVTAAFMLPKKVCRRGCKVDLNSSEQETDRLSCQNGQPTPIAGWPGSEDANATTVPL